MTSLAFVIINLCVAVLTLLGRIIFSSVDYGDAGVFLLFALIIIAVVAGASMWMKQLSKAMQAEGQAEGETDE